MRLSSAALRLPVSLATALALALPATSQLASEKLFGPIDLLGWRKAGALTVVTPPLDIGNADALLDNDPRTLVRAPALARGEVVLEFSSGQAVRAVTVVTGADVPCRVTLTVIESVGQRFKAGEFDVEGSQPATFHLLDVVVSRLLVDVERLDGSAPLTLADVVVEAQLDIVSIALEDAPETIPEGGSFPYRVIGRDSFGGRPDLTDRAQLVVEPARALALLPGFRALTRVQGPVSVQPHLGSLRGLMQPLLVTALAAAPPAPEAIPGQRVVTLHLQGDPPFEVFRRSTGAKSEESIGRTDTGTFYDDTVEPGVAYAYTVRGTDNLDNPVTTLSPEVRVRTLTRPPPGWTDPGRLPMLVVLFADSFGPGEQDAIVESVQAARLFIYRHSLGRIVLDLVFLEVDGPTPVTSGPTMLGIEQRLRQRGIRDDQFGIVFAIANDLEGDYGGFRLLGHAVGAMGRGAPVPTPPRSLGPLPGIAFSIVHELQHVFGSLAGEIPDALPLPSGHFTEDFGPNGVLGAWRGRPFDAGEAWDGAALLVASFDSIGRLGAPWRRPLEVLDTDGDGLPDADSRLPFDEVRFGSNPYAADTDADELPDFVEAAAGLYHGTDPRNPDTDGDGLSDDNDPWPLSNFTGVISKARPPRQLASVPTSADPFSPPVVLAASWNEQALAFEITTDRPCDAFLDIDGSGALGRWESDVNTGTPAGPASDVWAGPARISLRANTAPTGVFIGESPLPGAMVASERAPDGRYRLLAVLPRRLGPGATDAHVPPAAPRTAGLRLQAGTTLGLALTVRPSRQNEAQPFEPFPVDGEWTSLFETHRLMDARLQE